MAKRIADKELTDRNWDQEEEEEDAGMFSVASQEVLKTRAIKKAKRRNAGNESESGGAFKGFKGLFPVTGGSLSSFGNGSPAKPSEGLSNGTSTSLFINLKPQSKPTFGSAFTNRPLLGTAEKSTNGEKPLSSCGAALSKPGNLEYNKQLTSLNCSVRDWIVKHVNANPLCDLTPIFKDYEKHLSAIEQKYGASSESGSESDGAAQTKTIPNLSSGKTVSIATFSFGNKDKAPEAPTKTPPDSKPQAAPTFNFGQKVDSSTLGLISSGGAPNFSFSIGAPSLFGKNNGSTASSSSSQESEPSGKTEEKGEGEEEEEPPKEVIQEIKEDDAFYSKKCKLFYKKDNEFKEKGVGTLHLKPVENKKTQLLVRADTNLGNILLNILVQPSMPCSRTGKNNVMIVCVPNPPVDEKNPTVPVTLLVRVKSAEDADQLHKILLEKKEV
ncbi:hypothetical protein XELAEV_18016672mg [Xenopus laevis]|uniref:Nuclear pore complex protein Nup50 n=1 Tax=Xenopus laevis TaxID=8355 RepID=A0A974D9M1_XENLA|nr:hypothetical protein XELAEV_18016672mg [Xenopus laevis]